MICPRCRTENDNSYEFCQECGIRFSEGQPPVSNSGHQTVAMPGQPPFQQNAGTTNRDIPATSAAIAGATVPTGAQMETPSSSDEFQTVVRPPVYPAPSEAPARRSSKIPLILLGLLTIGLLGVIGILVIPPLLKKSVLPDHFGLFAKKDNQLSELRSREYSNLLKGRDELKSDSALPVSEPNPNVIVYSDGDTIPVGDLKLIKLDSIRDDGNVESFEYQVGPVDGDRRMKQIKIPAALAKGKYALAILKGAADDGTHRLWPFRVENGPETAPAGRLIALTLKPTPAATPTSTPTPQPTKSATPKPDDDVPANDGADDAEGDFETATCIEDNVVVRSSPTISNSNKIGRLDRGQSVTVIKYSNGTETWNGVTARWVYIKPGKGKSGWVFGAFLK